MTDTQTAPKITSPAPPAQVIKKKRIPTNLNGKLHCHTFIHLQIGLTTINESDAEETIIQFITDDASHPPVNAKIYDSIRQPLSEVHEVLTRLSHNMSRQEFISKTLSMVKNSTPETEVVAYFYQQQKL